MRPEELNGSTLAYLGDAVIELMVRERVATSGMNDVGKMNEIARSFVRATEQSRAVDRIIDFLTDDEISYFKRGRNTKGNTPKSASAVEYRRATGMESLFAYLYLKGDTERMRYLFNEAYKDHLNN